MPNNSNPDYIKYHQSIVKEIQSLKSRVRNLIGDVHWASDGTWKELVLINYLRRILPSPFSIGSGFIRNNQNELTKQIDIIIYNNRFPLLFSEGNFVIAFSESVLGIIEVKTKIQANKLSEITQTAQENGKIILDNTDNPPRELFNGVFAYDANSRIKRYHNTLKTCSHLKGTGRVNHVCLGENYFIKYWNGKNNPDGTTNKLFRTYDMSRNSNEGLAFSYFFSNMLESILQQEQEQKLLKANSQLRKYLYPIEGGKESCKYENDFVVNDILE